MNRPTTKLPPELADTHVVEREEYPASIREDVFGAEADGGQVVLWHGYFLDEQLRRPRGSPRLSPDGADHLAGLLKAAAAAARAADPAAPGDDGPPSTPGPDSPPQTTRSAPAGGRA